MQEKRELLVLFCLCSVLEQQSEQVLRTNIAPIREEIVLLTCQFGSKFKVQPWEVDFILDNPVSRLLFGK